MEIQNNIIIILRTHFKLFQFNTVTQNILNSLDWFSRILKNLNELLKFRIQDIFSNNILLDEYI